MIRLALLIQNRLINPIVRALIAVGAGPPTYALLETSGRRTGHPASCLSPTDCKARRSG
jgi:hypothetical protein